MLLALVLGVAALTSVTFFVDRVARSLVLQGAALMAGDLVVEQGNPIPPAWVDEAGNRGLRVSRQILFPSVIFHDDRPLLVQVKAVDGNYPLRGDFLAETPARQWRQGPVRNEVFISSILRNKLGAVPGMKLPLGNLKPEVAGTIRQEPDQGGSLFQFAPRMMVNLEDARNSGLLGAASRARYRLALAGAAPQLGSYRHWLEERLPGGARIMDVENARPEMRRALERGKRFPELAALCASLLAGIAILLASRQYVQQRMDSIAILRALGMSGWQALAFHLRKLLWVLALGALLGVMLGYSGQFLLSFLIGEWFGEHLPRPGWKGGLLGVAYALVLTLGFSLPSLLSIRQVPPLRVLRRELQLPGRLIWFAWGGSLLIFVGLLFWQVQDRQLAFLMLVLLAAIAVLALAGGGLLLILIRPLRRLPGYWGIGSAALSRNTGLTLWQLFSFCMGITLLLLLAIVRVDLLDAWQHSLPEGTPNYFLINVQPDEKAALQRWFGEQQIRNSGFFATTKGRLTHIDGKAVRADDYPDEQSRRLVQREFNLGFSDSLPADNRIVDGAPWQGRDGFSVEKELARRLGLSPGSRLGFDIGGQTLTAEVINLREVSWDSFNVNFFVQANAALMSGLPIAYISSLHLDEGQAIALGRRLAADHPAVSMLDINAMIERIRRIMDKGVLAVESVFLFTLLAALLVVMSAVQITRRERATEIAVMRSLGAASDTVLGSVVVEFGLLGALSGFISASLAGMAGQVLATRLFELEAHWNPLLWVFGMGGGVVVLILFGLLVMRRLLTTPPVQVLRSA
jgi:putative ABC transport system permease protein